MLHYYKSLFPRLLGQQIYIKNYNLNEIIEINLISVKFIPFPPKIFSKFSKYRVCG